MSTANVANKLSPLLSSHLKALSELGKPYAIIKRDEITEYNSELAEMLDMNPPSIDGLLDQFPSILDEGASSNTYDLSKYPTLPKFQEPQFERIEIDGISTLLVFHAAPIKKEEKPTLNLTPSKEAFEHRKQLERSLGQSDIIAFGVGYDGKVFFTNDPFQQIVDINDIQDKEIFDFFEPQNPDYKDTRLAELIDKDAIPTSFEVKYNNQQHDVVLWFHSVILRNEIGAIDCVAFIGENVTERRQVRKKLIKTNIQLKELFDNSFDLIQIFTASGKFRFVNDAWKLKLGYTDSEIQELHLKDLVDKDEQDHTFDLLERISSGENIDRFETVLRSKFGKKVTVSGRVNCTIEDNQEPEFRGIFYDITEKERAERAQKIYYKIANLTLSKNSITKIYDAVYEELCDILDIQNFTITQKQDKKDRFLAYPYYKYQHDVPGYPVVAELLANDAFERKKPCIIYEDGIVRIAKQKKIEIKRDYVPKIWLGVQITLNNAPFGILSIHSFKDGAVYNLKDLELLDFVAGQVSMALERQINQSKIISQDARLKSIFESSTHQIWSLDKRYHYTSLNKNYKDAVKNYFGVAPKIDQPYVLFSRSLRDKALKKFWKDRYNEALEGKIVNFQTSLEDLGGNVLWRDVYLNPIVLENGQIEEISVIASDITEKVASDVALRKSEEKFRNIFESFQDIYFRCNLDGVVTMVSPSVQDLLKILPEDAIGKDIREFFESEMDPKELLDNLYKKRKVKNFEGTSTVGRRKVRFLCNVRLLYSGDEPIEIEGVARDVTRLKNTNSALQKAKDLAEKSLKVKERFLANMSHEIRTPMNGIIGMIDLIASTDLSNEQLEYIKTIKKSSETLLAILNDILDLSKIEAGKMELKKKPVSLSTSIEKIYELYSHQARAKNIDLFYYLPHELPQDLMIDETRLMQIVSNLTSNAIKFSDGKGNINIAIRIIEKSDQHYFIKIQVKDAGIGISENNQKKLFTSFNQLDNSFAKTYAGTGLGLAISKELVHAMDGEIGVASTPGLGSTFWFTFKAEVPNPSDYEEVSPETSSGISKQFVNRAPKILLVDDNAINRTVASQILLKSGCDVISAEGGLEAIKMVEENTYDLIFMDIQMPVMDGVKATERIKEMLGAKTPPIVAMTAYSMEEDKKRILSKGLDDYIAKPIQAAPLINKVKDWLSFEHQEVKKEIIEEEQTPALIINQNKLNQLNKYGGKELIMSVLSDFEIESSMILDNCDKFADNKDFEGIKKELHTLKGNAGTLGVEIMAKCAAGMEKKLKENIFEGIDEDLIHLRRCFEDFRINRKNLTSS